MHCIIIDGEPNSVDQLTDYLHKTRGIGLLAAFCEPRPAIDFMDKHIVDFILLAVELPGYSGFTLYETCKSRPPVVFMGSNAIHAAESYNLNAIDYLLKPISQARFIKSIAKVQRHILLNRVAHAQNQLTEHAFINFKSGTLLHHVKTADILFLEKAGNYLTVFTRHKKILIRENMEGILSQLPAAYFTRVHKSYIVSAMHIDIVENHQLHIGSHAIPVAQVYRDALKNMLDKPVF
jgi:two-component system, LytTR family, response regulator